MRKKPGREGKTKETHPSARTITKFTEYVGSFAVPDLEPQQRVWMVEEQLESLKDCLRRTPVILKFSLQGVKMYSAAGETLLMAHAIKRILYTTCRPADRQFAFVARNPQASPQEVFCHLFMGSQRSEVQVLNLLLCRSFQLHYLSVHREEQERPLKKLPHADPGKTPPKAAVVVREPLDPEKVSQNVNALVSFRRLQYARNGKNFEIEEEITEEDSSSSPRDSVQETSHGSPTLVRKKAIRSKVLRSGAYRCNSFDTQQQVDGKLSRPSWVSSTVRACSCGSAAHLPESDAVLTDVVWSFAGICRDPGILLLRRDAIGAFLLRPEPGFTNRWRLTIRTPCGVVPYLVLRTGQDTYRFENLSEEFPSLACLIDRHSGAESGLFNRLVPGHLNPCYEGQDLLVKNKTMFFLEKHQTIHEQLSPTEAAG